MAGSFKYNPVGQNDSEVKVALADKNGKYTIEVPRVDTNNNKVNYTLTWKQSMAGAKGGTVTVTGTGNVFTGSITRTFSVTKVGLSTLTINDASALLGSNKVNVTLQHPTSPTVNGKPIAGAVLKAGKDYKITSQNENTTTKYGTVTFDASSSQFYTGTISSYNYKLYTDEVKSVKISLSSNGSVSASSVNKNMLSKKYTAYAGSIKASGGYEIEPTSVVITTKSGTKTLSTMKDITDLFDISFEDNSAPTTKAALVLKFKSNLGGTYPTGVKYPATYTIY